MRVEGKKVDGERVRGGCAGRAGLCLCASVVYLVCECGVFGVRVYLVCGGGVPMQVAVSEAVAQYLCVAVTLVVGVAFRVISFSWPG